MLAQQAQGNSSSWFHQNHDFPLLAPRPRVTCWVCAPEAAGGIRKRWEDETGAASALRRRKVSGMMTSPKNARDQSFGHATVPGDERGPARGGSSFLQTPEAAVHERPPPGHSKSPKALTQFPSRVVKKSDYSIKRAAHRAPVSSGRACARKRRSLVPTVVSRSQRGEDAVPATAALVPPACIPRISKYSGKHRARSPKQPGRDRGSGPSY